MKTIAAGPDSLMREAYIIARQADDDFDHMMKLKGEDAAVRALRVIAARLTEMSLRDRAADLKAKEQP